MPSKLVMGDRSPVRLALDPRSEANLEVESVPGAGHFLPEEAPEQLLALGEPFLAG